MNQSNHEEQNVMVSPPLQNAGVADGVGLREDEGGDVRGTAGGIAAAFTQRSTATTSFPPSRGEAFWIDPAQLPAAP